ncbi:FMN-binding glutamate synthase family protein [Sulfurimonas sp. MAG313]|nr:FMN-binding glutamate synthase family protein [Sulfurimonas sp. MAG313]MDF1882132.1 FMN-binding glutamate synthase family protein [Sulfurimonas sp. MAG313]
MALLDTLNHYFIMFLEYGFYISLFLLFNLFIYDRFIQRRHQLLINYPVIGRMRYVFEMLRDPMRQYFGEETFYESRDKIDWVYKAAKNVPNFLSYSVSQPFHGSRIMVKHSNTVLNEDELSDDFSVTFGENKKQPFHAKSVIFRSAMSDGALSPEGTRAFVIGSTKAGFPLNTGEGGLTSNYFVTHAPDCDNADYLEIVKSTAYAEVIFNITSFFFNRSMAINAYRKVLLHKDTDNTYIYDPASHSLFRPNWSASIETFPKEVPEDMPDLVLQIGSGLYGVRDKEGEFDPDRYAKAMRFCKMTEIKIAQGAKQTGGKIMGSKVSADIAYYRGVEQGKDLISPNRFPYANTPDELYDFISKCQEISGKPVGMKIVVSDAKQIEEMAEAFAQRKKDGKTLPDYMALDSGEGGSATAPLELMEGIGLTTNNALYVVDTMLRKHGVREDIKLISSGKILTPDDAVISLSLGADAVAIARGFMMSGGCIRARVCNGAGGHICPVGLATQDPRRRGSYLVVRKSNEIANYHNNLKKGIKTMLSVMGLKKVNMLNKNFLSYKNNNGEIFFDIDKYFHHKLHI